jgi:hypothetical protein
MNAQRQVRQFDVEEGVRRSSRLLIGLVGPSSSGKTFSGLRLATGIQRVVGGDLHVIDTENKRALAYADQFKFKHLDFRAPFSPEDYLDAIRYSVQKGAKTILIDSMSHEHEGPGGVLEWHERETDRLMQAWKVSRDKAQMAAWGPPKRARRKLINEMLQMDVNLICAFRAKEKIKIKRGEDPEPIGWQPISGDEFMYEFALQALLVPNCEGHPIWNPEMSGEKAMVKLPKQFRSLFNEKGNEQLSEHLGEEIAKWAAGGVKGDADAEALLADYAKCSDKSELADLEKRRAAIWEKTAAPEQKALKAAKKAASERLTATPAASTSAEGPRISLDQSTVIADGLKAESIEVSRFLAHFELGTIEELPAAKYDAATAWMLDGGNA